MAELNCTLLKNSTSLKGYWRFEETSGTLTTDTSGNGNTGTASRTAILNNSNGKFGNCAVFNRGSSDYIALPNSSTTQPTGNFSIGCWFSASSTAVYRCLAQSRSNISGKVAGIQLEVDDTGKIYIESGKNTGVTIGVDRQFAIGTSTVTDNTWKHGVGTWDGSTLRIYVNGVLEGTTSWANADVYNATTYTRIGNARSDAIEIDFFNGTIDDAFIFNGTALSQADITKLYSGACDSSGFIHDII